MKPVYRIIGGRNVLPAPRCDGHCIPVRFIGTVEFSPGWHLGFSCGCANSRPTRTLRGGPLDGARVAWPDDKVAVWIPTTEPEGARLTLYEAKGRPFFTWTGSVPPNGLEMVAAA